jgi:hypothetical protein
MMYLYYNQGMARLGMARHGKARHGLARHGMARHGMEGVKAPYHKIKFKVFVGKK